MVGSVRAINEVSPIVRVRDELVDAISSGLLAPKWEISLDVLAEERGLRPEKLTRLLTETDRRDLFTVRGGTLIVAPLDADEFHSAFTLTRTIEDHLIERCCRQAGTARLHQLKRELADMRNPDRWGPTDISASGFADRLFALAATSVERTITRQLRQATQRCINIGGRLHATSTERPGVDPRSPTPWFLDTWHEILTCVGTSDVSGALRHIGTNNRKKLAEFALSSPLSGNLAPVVDFASRARLRGRRRPR